MNKMEGKKIGIKFTQPINPLVLTESVAIDETYTSPSGTVTYSNQFSTTYAATNVFDKNIATMWIAATAPQWVMIQLPTAKQIAGFRLYSGASYRANSVDLFGSNDGANFELIAQTTNANATGWNNHAFDATIPYKYFKWVVNNTHTTGWVYVHELELLFANSVILSGEESAFTVTGEEYEKIGTPHEENEIIAKAYPILLVQTHPTEPYSILINTVGFRNAQGNLVVSYDQHKGTLANGSSLVESFQKLFTPVDIVEGLTDLGGNTGSHDYIAALVSGAFELKYITKIPTYETEYVLSTVSGAIQLIHINDINP